MDINKGIGAHYGLLAFYNSILHNIFLLFHVEIFVSIYKIDKLSFWLGETIFLIWNSCNDPLFGWLSDKGLLTSNVAGSLHIIITKRITAIQWNGPFFALAFLSFWVRWTFPSVQFVVCLCLYDGFLTMLDLHHSSLLADLAVSADTRTRLNFWSSCFSAAGSASVFLSYVAWNRENLFVFQVYCAIVSCISVCGFLYSTHFLKKWFASHKFVSEETLKSDRGSYGKDDLEITQTCDGSPGVPGVCGTKDKDALKKFIKELSGHHNFMWFAAMNLIQVFHCHFNSNFFPLFLENLLGDSVPQLVCSLILGVSFIAPHLNNLYFLTLCRKYGVYAVVRGLFFVKLAISLVMYSLGPGYMWLLCIYIASNRVFTEGTCKLLTLVISDLVDEDYVIHHRKQAVSALIFGTSALLSKPGQTLAPLVGTWLLARQTGHDVFAAGNTDGSIKLDLTSMSAAAQAEYREGVFTLLVMIPTVCAVLQLLAWSRFNLKGKRLQWIKSVREGAGYYAV